MIRLWSGQHGEAVVLGHITGLEGLTKTDFISLNSLFTNRKVLI